jgi:NAD(P)-dependent dehydrogenase (short-subunit alcohol dehydrogenase family)
MIVLITGATDGLGRALANALDAAGETVLVHGRSDERIAATLAELSGRARGYRADLASLAEVRRLADEVLDKEPRLDVLVNNAGIMRWASFPEAGADDLASHLAVHVAGSFHTTRAAWPHMVDAGYGRIVMTTSSGIFGLPDNACYATAKAAVIGLTRSLTLAGSRHGIKVNLIAPAAVTRMAGRAAEQMAAQMSPDLVAPLVAYLAHEDCPVSGEIYAAGAGRFARIFVASTDGYIHDTEEPTIEDIARHWPAINDETSYHVPADTMSWSTDFLAHLL